MLPFIFTNPNALWALLALPVILLIHCLQERSRRVRSSTLFLLERIAPESVSGATFERLRNSLPLWLQLLAALLITWMLAGPRWLKQDSSQSVVVVLDSSASMSAYKAETREALAATLRQWTKNSARTRWHLLESDPRKPTLYAGDDLTLLLASYEQWQPSKGTHSPQEALGIARGLVRDGHGIVIFVTDHRVTLPSDISLLSAATAIDNVGFTGLTISFANSADMKARSLKWRALVKNHSATPQTREWWLEPEAKPAAQPLATPEHRRFEIGPGQALAIEGELPPDIERAVLHVSPDRFGLDDLLPFCRPTERALRVASEVTGPSGELLRKMVEAGEALTFVPSSESPDVTLSSIGSYPATDAIFIDQPAPEGAKLQTTAVLAENHPLVRELNWSGLLTPAPGPTIALPSDTALLWKGDAPLAFHRRTQNAEGKDVRQLFLNWDLAKSNAHRQPAPLILLHRFLDELRRDLDGERSANYETGERITLPTKALLAKLQLSMNGKAEAFTGRAPEQSGFFELTREGKPFVHGATHFGDARESDFREAEALDTTVARRIELALSQSEADPLTPLWMLLVLGCLLGAWATTK